MKVIRLSALRTGRLYLQQIFLVLISVRGWVNPRATVWPEGSFIHLVVCLTTGPKPLPKRALHIVRSRASSFKWEFPLLSLRSSNSFLRLHPCLPVTSIPPCIFPSVTRCRRQFRRKMWPIQFAFRLRISCRIFLCSFTLSNTSSFLTWLVQLILSILLQHHISKLSRCFCRDYRRYNLRTDVHSLLTKDHKCWVTGYCRKYPLTMPRLLKLCQNWHQRSRERQ